MVKRGISRLGFFIKNNSFLKPKRSQIALFIIIVVLLIPAIIAIFILNQTPVIPDPRVEEIPNEIMPAYDFIKECVDITAEDVIFYIGQTGGYIFPPGKSTDKGAAYYYDRGLNIMPSLHEIENEISEYMQELLPLCTINPDDFKGFIVEGGDPEIITTIESNKVTYDIKFPVSIMRDGKTYSIEDFEAEVPVRLGIIYNAIKEFIDNQVARPEEVCITCITRIAEENDLYFEMYDYALGVLLFDVVDKNSIILEDDYEFKFAMEY